MILKLTQRAKDQILIVLLLIYYFIVGLNIEILEILGFG